MLTDGEEKLRERGVYLWLVAMNPEVWTVVERSQLGERLGRAQTFFTLEQAVTQYQQQTGVTAPQV
jgi:hypothetical protein